jgi:hypothetical protein
MCAGALVRWGQSSRRLRLLQGERAGTRIARDEHSDALQPKWTRMDLQNPVGKTRTSPLLELMGRATSGFST